MSTQQENIRDHQLNDSISHMCGITMSDSAEGRAVAEAMQNHPGVNITRLPAMIRIDCEGRMTFDMDEISEILGRDYDPYTFQIEMSTHYGRMSIADDRTVVLYGNLEEYLEEVGAVED
ncbi:MAG: MmoB/DmpM family protein [Thiotrichales bacterium]|nr:MmoB/DmpM family protein [Thiotrichales bacterium]